MSNDAMTKSETASVEEDPTAATNGEEEAVVDAAAAVTGENANANANANAQEERPEHPPGTDAVEQESQQEQQPAEAVSGNEASAAPSPEEFVNNGLAKWLAARETWCGAGGGNGAGDKGAPRKAVPIDVDGVIDVLFDPRWRGGGRIKVSLEPPRFPTNVPLPQMIDVLTDLWEAEGLDV